MVTTRGGEAKNTHVEHARCGRGASEKEKPWAESFRRALGDDAVMLLRQTHRKASLIYEQNINSSNICLGERGIVPEGHMIYRVRE